MGVVKSRHTVHDICRNTYSRTAQKTSLGILCGIGVFYLFFDILYGDKAFKISRIINDRKFFNSGLCKNVLCLFKGDTLFGCYQILRSHLLPNRFIHIGFKLQIPVCNNTHQLLSLGNGYTGDSELCHKG